MWTSKKTRWNVRVFEAGNVEAEGFDVNGTIFVDSGVVIAEDDDTGEQIICSGTVVVTEMK